MDMMLGKGFGSTAPRESIELTHVEPELVGQLPGVAQATIVHQTGPRDALGRLVGGGCTECQRSVMTDPTGLALLMCFGIMGIITLIINAVRGDD
jgi:hypothetical protein